MRKNRKKTTVFALLKEWGVKVFITRDIALGEEAEKRAEKMVCGFIRENRSGFLRTECWVPVRPGRKEMRIFPYRGTDWVRLLYVTVWRQGDSEFDKRTKERELYRLRREYGWGDEAYGDAQEAQ